MKKERNQAIYVFFQNPMVHRFLLPLQLHQRTILYVDYAKQYIITELQFLNRIELCKLVRPNTQNKFIILQLLIYSNRNSRDGVNFCGTYDDP